MKRPFALLILALLIAGCQTPQRLLSTNADLDLDIRCRDRIVNVIHTPGALIQVGQPLVEVCPGSTVTVRIRPRASGSTEAKPETPADWLSGTADGDGNIVLTVPTDTDFAFEEYGYTVTIDDTGSIDPIFRIIE